MFFTRPLEQHPHGTTYQDTIFRSWTMLVCSSLLFALLFLALAPHLVDARGGTWQGFMYNGAAGSRSYFVYTPANYIPGTAIPLIVMLHGCMQTATDFAAGTQMDQLADTHQFFVVYPQQAAQNNGTNCWNWFVSTNQTRASGEPAIIAGIVQAVEHNATRWTIDRSRIYVAGISAGAMMAGILGATYPDMFAAIGVVAGGEYPRGASSTDGLDPQRQGELAYEAMGSHARVVPNIVFQGSADTIVSPINGDLAVQQWMQTDSLASHDQYHATFAKPSRDIDASPPQSYPYRLRSWNDNGGQEMQEYWWLEGAGHAWTGGSSSGTFSDPLGPNISQAMYSFFLGHSMK